MLEFHDTLFQDNRDFPLSCNMSWSSTLKLPPKCIIEKVTVFERNIVCWTASKMPMASHWNFTMERDSLCFFYDKMQCLDEHAWNFWASITLSLDECPVLLWNSTSSVSLALTCIRLFLVHSLMISLVPAVCLAEEILQGSLESCDSCKCCKSSSGSVLDDNSWWSCNCVWLAEVVALEVTLESCNSCKFCKSSGSFSDDKILLGLQVYVLQDSL